MKKHIILTLVILSQWLNCACGEETSPKWHKLFNGVDLSGWKEIKERNGFSVENGILKAHASDTGPSHLFYVGKRKEGFVSFKNFELRATVKAKPNSNSGIFFHTNFNLDKKDKWLLKGYEIQLNNAKIEKRKTGSVYAIQDLDKSPVDESNWFEIHIRVQNKHITVSINGKVVNEYTEPDNPERGERHTQRLIDPNGGAIALQAHDPNSVFYFKDIQIREIPLGPLLK